MPSVLTYSTPSNGPRRLRAVLMRSGTSKGLFFRREDLPTDREDWAPLILAAMGSPDSYGRQLNGCGGGTSTQSKVAVVGRCEDSSIADIDYTFCQVGINSATLDFSGNCGNMSAGCGPFAVAEGLCIPSPSKSKNMVTVRIRNTNTNSIINSTFAVVDGYPVEKGDMVISGVAGSGAPIRLDFVNPAGAMTGQLLPTGNALDTIVVPATPDHSEMAIPATMVDSANPFVFLRASDLGLRGDETPAQLAPLTPLIQEIRALASVKMGLAADVDAARLRMGVPKIAVLGNPSSYTTTAGTEISASEVDVMVRAYSNGTVHPALQVSGAICLASACSIPGSIPHSIVAQRASKGGPLRFAHPSGITAADHDASVGIDGRTTISSGSVYRTARRLMEGNVLIDV